MTGELRMVKAPEKAGENSRMRRLDNDHDCGTKPLKQ
jgi:hypothetical protein